MGREDAQRPTGRPCGSPSAQQPVPVGSAPRVAELSALLADIDALRTSLQTDLSLVAAALDVGAESLAVELVDGNIRAVHSFEVRAITHLQAMHEAAPVTGRTRSSAARRAPAHSDRTRRRLVPSAPALVAAAALIGFVVGVVPDRGTVRPAPAGSSTVVAGDSVNPAVPQETAVPDVPGAAERRPDDVVAQPAVSPASPAPLADALVLPQPNPALRDEPAVAVLRRDALTATRSLADRVRTTVFLPAAPPVLTPASTDLGATISAVPEPEPEPGPPPSGPSTARPAPSAPEQLPYFR